MALLGNADLVAASPRRVKSRLEHSNWRAWLRHSRFYHVSPAVVGICRALCPLNEGK